MVFLTPLRHLIGVLLIVFQAIFLSCCGLDKGFGQAPLALASSYSGFFFDKVEILPYGTEKNGAVSFVFDDNNPDHYDIVAPILEKHGVRGTFSVTPGDLEFQTVMAPHYKTLIEKGHELAVHGWYHIDLSTIPSADLVQHMVTQPLAILRRLFDYVPVTYNFANGVVPPGASQVFAANYYVSKHIAIPRFPRLGFPIIKTTTLGDVNAVLDQVTRTGRWSILGMHGVDGRGWSDGSISHELLEAIVSSVVARGIYVGTEGQIGLREYLAAACSLDVVTQGEETTISVKGFQGLKYPVNESASLLLKIPYRGIVPVVAEGARSSVRVDSEALFVSLDLREGRTILVQGVTVDITK